jgi:hypothetical protein
MVELKKICKTCNIEKNISDFHKHRGLLCNKCNFGIGQFNDDIELLKKAIKYLEEK